MARWLIIGPVAVVCFDTLASIAARSLDFDYGSLWPLSILLTVGIAFLAGRDTGSTRVGVLAGLALAFADATVGWTVSWLIGPGAPTAADRDALTVAVTAWGVTALGAIEGLLGGWLGARRTSNWPLQPT